MSVEEAREVAERFVDRPGASSYVSVDELARALQASPEEIEGVLAEVRGRGRHEVARSRERRNMWLTGLAAVFLVGVMFSALFVGRSSVTVAPPAEAPVVWGTPPPMPEENPVVLPEGAPFPETIPAPIADAPVAR